MARRFICILTAIIFLMPTISVCAFDNTDTNFNITEDNSHLQGGAYKPIESGLKIISATYIPDAESDSVCLSNASPSFFNTPNEGSFTPVSLDDYYGYNTLKTLPNGELLARLYVGLYNFMAGVGNSAVVDVSSYNGSLDDFKAFLNTNFPIIRDAYVNDFPNNFYYDQIASYMGVSIDFSSTPKTATFKLYTSSIIELTPVIMDIRTKKSAFETAVNTFIENSRVTPQMNDYEKALLLHNELARKVIYNKEVSDALNIEDEAERNAALDAIEAENPYIHTAYGSLINGDAVCDGYAKAYQYALYKVGILSHMVSGTAGGGGHAWNLVKLDGDWYYTDVTWDDDDYTTFHSYFNITTAQLQEDHNVRMPYPVPACTAVKNNYFQKNGGIMTPDGNLENVVSQLEKSMYAKVYITGDIISASDIWSWFISDATLSELRSALKVNDLYLRLLNIGREFQLYLIFDRVTADKEFVVDIGSLTDRNAKIYQVFYDENGAITNVCSAYGPLEKNTFKRLVLKPQNDFTNFAYVKYFMVNPDSVITPIGNSALVEY